MDKCSPTYHRYGKTLNIYSRSQVKKIKEPYMTIQRSRFIKLLMNSFQYPVTLDFINIVNQQSLSRAISTKRIKRSTSTAIRSYMAQQSNRSRCLKKSCYLLHGSWTCAPCASCVRVRDCCGHDCCGFLHIDHRDQLPTQRMSHRASHCPASCASSPSFFWVVC
jgi:hypothetical protein